MTVEPEEPATEEVLCQHHWIIEPSAGPTSNGVCQRCGAEKEFQNTVEADTWARGANRGQPASNTEG